MRDEWLSIDEAIWLTKYHPEWLRELLRNNKVVGRKNGNGVWQVSLLSLFNYVEEAKSSEDRRRGSKQARKGNGTQGSYT